jgi:hypothetical protein
MLICVICSVYSPPHGQRSVLNNPFSFTARTFQSGSSFSNRIGPVQPDQASNRIRPDRTRNPVPQTMMRRM